MSPHPHGDDDKRGPFIPSLYDTGMGGALAPSTTAAAALRRYDRRQPSREDHVLVAPDSVKETVKKLLSGMS
jgi:hypothetical protein